MFEAAVNHHESTTESLVSGMSRQHLEGHGAHESSDMCQMSMLFTLDPNNLCVVFKWWHVRNYLDLLLTIIAIIILSAGYEFVRYRIRILESASIIETDPRATRALGYAFLVGYSYFLMLIFMTYNFWAMISVCIGAFLGHYLWGDKSARQLSCH